MKKRIQELVAKLGKLSAEELAYLTILIEEYSTNKE